MNIGALKRGRVALFFDTETTGLPDYRRPSEDPRQPRLVQIAFILAEIGGEERASVSMLIRPDGWEIPTDASDVHGITTQIAEQFGVPLRTAVSCFCHHLVQAEYLVAHNIRFDLAILESALHQIGAANSVPGLHRPVQICTQESTRDIVQCPPTERMLAAGIMEYKSPRLSESFQHFTGKELIGAHDALVDVRACRQVLECVWETQHYRFRTSE